MSYRESFSNVGRPSPYGSLTHNDRSISDMFEYVGADDDHRSDGHYEDDDAPDVINICSSDKFLFKAKFLPFSISESRVFVEDIRHRVARKLNEDPRKIRLYYKGRELVENARSLKSYGCKQNSEVEVSIDDNVAAYSPVNNHAVADDVYRAPPQDYTSRNRANSAVRDRDRQTLYYEDHNPTPRSSGFLHPEEHTPTSRPRRSYSTSRPAPATTTRVRRDPSPATAMPTATSVPPSPRRPTRPIDPSSPMGKVFALREKFEDKYLPEAQKFLTAPPKDQSVRQNTYNQVVENLMKHVIEAADGIMTEGDKDARAERKYVVTTAQEVLKRLDAAHKLWN